MAKIAALVSLLALMVPLSLAQSGNLATHCKTDSAADAYAAPN